MYVFISYSSQNKADADAIRALLEKNGIRVWMAPDSIPPGSNYMSEITPAIENCGYFLLLLSEDSEKSYYVQCEVSTATHTQPNRILPITRGYMPQGALRFPFETIQIRKVQEINESDRNMLEILCLIKGTQAKETALENRQEPQSFEAAEISSLNNGQFLYLGAGTSQFSDDNTCYFLYDKEQGNAILAHLPDMQVLGFVQCDPDHMVCSCIRPSPDNHYLLMHREGAFSIADLLNHRWIIRGRRPKTGMNEQLLYWSWGSSDNVYLLFGTENKNRYRISSVVELSIPDKKEKRTELTAVSPYEAVGQRKLEGSEWTFFTTEDSSLVAVCFESMTYSDSTWEILEQVRAKTPASSAGIDQFSPDSLSFSVIQNSGTGQFINVYDAKDQVRLLQLPLTFVGGISLLNDYRALIYHRSKGTVFLHDFKSQMQNTVIDARFFRENASFYHTLPLCAEFDRLTQCALFLAADQNTSRFRIVAVDPHKTVTAVSGEYPLPFEKWRSAEILLAPGGLLAGFSVVPGDGEFRDHGVNSYYRYAQFHRENGRVVFDEGQPVP